MASSSSRLKPIDVGKIAKQREGLRKEPQDSTIPTPRFARNVATWNLSISYRKNLFSKLCDGKSEKADLGTAFRSQTPQTSSVRRSI